LEFPNSLAIIINYTPDIKPFSGAVAGEEVEDFCEGSFSHAHPLLCLLFCFTLFLLALFYQKPTHKKISILYSCYFCWFVIVLLYHAFYQWLVSLKLNLFGKVGSRKSDTSQTYL
jgi:hypothetical protein